MFKLKYEEIIDYKKWVDVLFIGTLACVVLACIGELIAVLAAMPYVQAGARGDLWLKVFIIPVLSFAAVIVLMWILIRFFSSRKQFTALAFVAVTAISAICFLIVNFHYNDALIYAVFIFPILGSLLFIDIKPLLFSFLYNLFNYLLFVFVALPRKSNPAEASQGFYEILTNILFLFACFVVALAMLHFLSSLVGNIIHKGEQLRHDSFTKLLNHTSFYEHLNALIDDPAKPEFSLVFWDLDDFKGINDVYGHDMGDQVLLQFAAALSASLRPGEFAFRYGGEEFALLLRQGEQEALLLSDRIRNTFQSAAEALPIGRKVTACAGICAFDYDTFSGAEDLFNAADTALYLAKKAPGKNICTVFKEGMTSPARRRSDLARGIRKPAALPHI